ncbi:MAG: c-type cytochrome [Verrucomicrobiota bacterium]|nr:c-type cytochrome [Verrucomicrobiota bacterium]
MCEKLLEVREIAAAAAAARGLGTFDDPKIGSLLVRKYQRLYAHDRAVFIEVLASRVAWARTLLESVGNGQIAKQDVNAYHVRQMRGFNDAAITRQLAELAFEPRSTEQGKKARIAQLAGQLTAEELAKAELSAGRAIFNQVCAACHKLYGQGGELGPDLTGSGRSNLAYLLDNIVDPSAVLTVDFRMSMITTRDGQLLTGFVTRNERTLTVRSMTGSQTLEHGEVASIAESPQSIMPEGLLDALSEAQVRDLIAYLMHPKQVPLPAGHP